MNQLSYEVSREKFEKLGLILMEILKGIKETLNIFQNLNN